MPLEDQAAGFCIDRDGIEPGQNAIAEEAGLTAEDRLGMQSGGDGVEGGGADLDGSVDVGDGDFR